MERLACIRYADHLVVIHSNQDILLKCKEIVSDLLSTMGLSFKPEFTRIIEPLRQENQNVALDFLGFRLTQRLIGKYRVKKCRPMSTSVTRVTPTPHSIKRHKNRLRESIQSTQNVETVLALINPKIRDWAQYYRICASKQIFGEIDSWMYYALFQWARKKHPTRGKSWIVDKYFKQIYPNKWIFGIKRADQTTIKQRFHRESSRERYVKVQGLRSPYDGDWAYWSKRMHTC